MSGKAASKHICEKKKLTKVTREAATNPTGEGDKQFSYESYEVPPPPPGGTDVWQLQFCKWWGWNWVRKPHSTQIVTTSDTQCDTLRERTFVDQPTQCREMTSMESTKEQHTDDSNEPENTGCWEMFRKKTSLKRSASKTKYGSADSRKIKSSLLAKPSMEMNPPSCHCIVCHSANSESDVIACPYAKNEVGFSCPTCPYSMCHYCHACCHPHCIHSTNQTPTASVSKKHPVPHKIMKHKMCECNTQTSHKQMEDKCTDCGSPPTRKTIISQSHHSSGAKYMKCSKCNNYIRIKGEETKSAQTVGAKSNLVHCKRPCCHHHVYCCYCQSKASKSVVCPYDISRADADIRRYASPELQCSRDEFGFARHKSSNLETTTKVYDFLLETSPTYTGSKQSQALLGKMRFLSSSDHFGAVSPTLCKAQCNRPQASLLTSVCEAILNGEQRSSEDSGATINQNLLDQVLSSDELEDMQSCRRVVTEQGQQA